MSPQYELIMRSVAQNTIIEEKLFENFRNDVYSRGGTRILSVGEAEASDDEA